MSKDAFKTISTLLEKNKQQREALNELAFSFVSQLSEGSSRVTTMYPSQYTELTKGYAFKHKGVYIQLTSYTATTIQAVFSEGRWQVKETFYTLDH